MPPESHSTRRSPLGSASEWKRAYDAVLAGTGTREMFKLVEIAEAAILTRRDALSSSPDHQAERRILTDALNNIRTLKRERLKFHDLGPLHGANRTGAGDPVNSPTSAAAVFSLPPASYGTEGLFLPDAPPDGPCLVDVRQIGPDSERHISGVCSTCGDTVFARLHDSSAEPTPQKLRAELESIFRRHAAQH